MGQIVEVSDCPVRCLRGHEVDKAKPSACPRLVPHHHSRNYVPSIPESLLQGICPHLYERTHPSSANLKE